MKRFLTELEARLAELAPVQRQELLEAVGALIRAVTVSTGTIGRAFKPSKAATLGVLMELVGALGGGGAAVVSKLKKLAPSIGPHVSTLVQTL